jgi:hypothetical protein
LLNKTIEARTILAAHMHELHAHTVTGAAVSDDAAGADFAAGYVKEKLYVGARGQRMGDEKERSAYA